MKKIIIKILVLLLIFIGSASAFALILNDETRMQTEDMAGASLPVVYVVYKDVEMNPLHGYVKPMQVTAVRDSLTPISTERTVSIKVKTFGTNVEDIYFEVFSADGKKSLENTKVTEIKRDDDTVTANFTLQNLMHMNQEYVLKIQLKVNGRDVFYYTRVVQQDSLHTKEYLDFVTSFSDKCLNKSGADILALYMEPEEGVEEVDLSFMDIHTTTDQLVWGSLNPQIYFKSVPVIRELNETTATIVQEYLISAKNEEDKTELYTVNEYFRLRCADETVMLLDFERTTDEVFNPDNNVMTSNGIRLGITDKEIDFVSDDANHYFAFSQGGELWSYDIASGKMAQVFTFRQKDNSDFRDMYGQHEIKVISISSGGNIYFVVAGYMNRGRHEGQSGVALYYYDASSGGIEEKLFVSTDRSFDLMRADVREIAYVSDDQEDFYLLLGGTVYEINLTTFEVKTIIEGMKPGCYAGSGSGRKFAYLNENDPYDSRTITIMDLDTGETGKIVCGENERLRMAGYIRESLVYGVAEASDIDSTHEGDELFPMKQIVIVNEQGEKVKEYGETGIYVTGTTISDRLLTMQRMRKTSDGWEEASEDHIIDNVADDSAVGVTTQVSSRKQTEIVLLLGDDQTPKTPQVVRSRMIVKEGNHVVEIQGSEQEEDLFYVYGKGKLNGIYEHANAAIVTADSLFGLVVDQHQNYIWERGNRQDIADIPLSQIPQSILSGNMDLSYLTEQLPDKRVLDLSGCVMDEILYFISEGNPILADTADGIRLLTGYDQWGNIRYYEPGAEETYLLSDEDSLELFEKSGNIFIGFLNKPKE